MPINLVKLAIKTARLRSKSSRPTSSAGWCKREVRECFGLPSNGTPSASAAWDASPSKHPITDLKDIPRGAVIYWTGGSDGAGHIAIYTGYGKVWSTDILRTGYFDKVPLDLISTRWPALHLAGWSEHVEGIRVLDAKILSGTR